jgi:hypothetical protein
MQIGLERKIENLPARLPQKDPKNMCRQVADEEEEKVFERQKESRTRRCDKGKSKNPPGTGSDSTETCQDISERVLQAKNAFAALGPATW